MWELLVNIFFAKYSEIQNSLIQSDQKTHFLFEYYLLSQFHYEETNDGYTFLYLFRLLVGRIIHISPKELLLLIPLESSMKRKVLQKQ